MSGRLSPKKVMELKSGHASLASHHPKEIAGLIDEAAKAVSK